MADFSQALPFVLNHEGYYSNAAGDTGGETWRGVSRNNWPQWEGWAIIDAYEHDSNFPRCLRALPTLDSLVAVFYRSQFWEPVRGDQIVDQDIATRVLDAAVNCGVRQAAKLIQRAAGVADDGMVGPVTLAAINGADPATLLAAFRAQRVSLYQAIAANHPQDQQFLEGWLRRAVA
ncbi:MAG: glycoside hydrolase family 108 protein [Terriglobales bacterium]